MTTNDKERAERLTALIGSIVEHQSRLTSLRKTRQRWADLQLWDQVDAADVVIRDEERALRDLEKALEDERPPS